VSGTHTVAQAAVLEWARDHGRDLPWRRTRDPWAVLVSELMLQQTQVPRVVPRFHAFLQRFPTVGSCAGAPVGEVVRLWHGLGHNRRAVLLHRAATVISHEHGGEVPGSIDALLGLPGVGPYTARAVLAFAHGEDVGVLDVNTARVLARAWGSSGQHDADAAVPRGEGWAWNQALLDLGATVCTRRSPRCHECPLAAQCAWRAGAAAGPDPAVPAGRQPRFAGSDRQGRGRLVAALRRGPVATSEVAAAAGWPDDPDRASRIVATLLADGLVVSDGAALRLP
jgi:A/G-specific adenine glycosylase